MQRIFIPIMAMVLATALVPDAGAQESRRAMQVHGIGPRVGGTVNPDQFTFGGQVDLGDPFPRTTFLFPVVEIGLGDDVTLASIGADLLFRLSSQWGEWAPYLGPELALLIANVDLPPGFDDQTNSDLGISGVFGVEKQVGDNDKFGVEIKFQIVDAPDVKFMAHWTFGR